MIKSFRIKVTTLIMSILTIVLIGILISIYLVSYHRSMEYTKMALKKLCKSNGFSLLDKPTKKELYYDSSDYYLVFMDNDKKNINIANNDNSGLSNKQLSDLAVKLTEKRTAFGNVNNLLYYKIVRKGGIYVAFANNNIQIDYLNSLLYTMLLFGSIGIGIIFIFSITLSQWLISPIENAFIKQRQFISNASHELKTPIAIITSNADVLGREIGNNKWLEYMKTEATRMNGLVSDLLQLAAMDSKENKKMFTNLNFSELALGIALPFESVAYEKQVDLSEQIEEDIYIIGDSIQLGQLIAILIDNALNYSEKNGHILIKVTRQRDKKILTVTNTGNEIPVSEQEHIFERFYRLNDEHTRDNGNYGLGLAIAKSITQNHGGKISVTSKNGITTFRVVF